MSIPTINPNLSANMTDQSMVDDSIKQEGVNIQAGAGSVLNMNSGNEKVHGKSQMQFLVILVLMIGFIVMGGMIYMTNQMVEQKQEIRHQQIHQQIEKINQISQKTDRDLEQMIKALDVKTQNALQEASDGRKKSQDGIIWMLRRDIVNSIDIHEATKTITSMEYKRLKDQVEYYFSIGGNHDVHSRWEDFNVLIFGTNEIKMTK